MTIKYDAQRLVQKQSELREIFRKDMKDFLIQHSEMAGMTIGTMKQIVHYQELHLNSIMKSLVEWLEENSK